MKLTQEQKRVKLAEACGWKLHQQYDDMAFFWSAEACTLAVHPDREGSNKLPDYSNDLNAMHEAEKVLSWMQQQKYYSLLYDMTASGLSSLRQFNMIHVDAGTRFEALGQTLKLWDAEGNQLEGGV